LSLTEGQDYSKKILEGLASGTSHWHAVDYMKNELKSNGFTEIKETDKWNESSI
jgi:aspartyl aminopeptidase